MLLYIPGIAILSSHFEYFPRDSPPKPTDTVGAGQRDPVICNYSPRPSLPLLYSTRSVARTVPANDLEINFKYREIRSPSVKQVLVCTKVEQVLLGKSNIALWCSQNFFFFFSFSSAHHRRTGPDWQPAALSNVCSLYHVVGMLKGP